jgi:hypothetical protein
MPEAGASCPAELTTRRGLSADQVRRWASLIAEGRSELPADLQPQDRERLEAEVRRQLRHRLIHCVARAIAQRIRRDTSANRKVSTDV